MRSPSKKQRALINYLLQNDRHAKFDDLLANFGYWYYANQRANLSKFLSRMVGAGFLIRLKPGEFQLSRKNKSKPQAAGPMQKELF